GGTPTAPVGGTPGNDYLYNATTIAGGDGNDFIVASKGTGDLNGGLGNDYLYTNAGQKQAWGGFGDDFISGRTVITPVQGGPATKTPEEWQRIWKEYYNDWKILSTSKNPQTGWRAIGGYSVTGWSFELT
ncbi:hypothetical protein PZA18_24380, partial [Chitinimonas sp. DQS-5]|nr:hypothetical protein [Parachitinimonas caeni]